MPLPKIIDNERSSMLEVLRALCKEHKQLSIATGYWDLGAILLLLEELDSLSQIRLLIGREPLIPRHKLTRPEGDFPDQDFQFDLAMVDQTSDLRSAADKVTEWIASGQLKVKVFTRTFLHAKTYIFGDFESNNAVGVIGSSNFTKNGLTQNTELNALESDHRVVTYQPKTDSQETGHLSWFEGMWADESSVEWTERFGEVIETSPVGNRFFSPFETYIKTLHTLYRDELEETVGTSGEKQHGRTLFEFQQKNTQALLRRLSKYKVAMLSDSVGLGKTTTAINVIRNYIDDPSGRKRVEIICPKSIVQQWAKELASEQIFGQSPLTLQNANELAKRQELDSIAAVSLFVIDESHNLRQTTGVRFKQLLDWIRNNPKAHVLLLTATPINNNLSDLSNQILLGTGGDTEVMKITVTDSKGKTSQITFHQAVENLKKKVNQDLHRDGRIDYQAIRDVMTPIIRTFVVRRTRQGIQSEYGSLVINGEARSFPKVNPGVIEYNFSKQDVEQISQLKSSKIDLNHIYSIRPGDLLDKCKALAHPYAQAIKLEGEVEGKSDETKTPMFYIFQLILLLGFMPYRWMMYQSKYHGKSREQISELRMGAEESKKLLLQLGIFGILRTVFLKRMESSVSALRTSLDTYQRKLLAFERGVLENRIVSVADLGALEASLGDEDLEVDEDLLEDATLDHIDDKKYNVQALLADIQIEKEIIEVLDRQLEIIAKDDSKIKQFAAEIDRLRADQPNRKILVFSYFSDTVKFLAENLFKHSITARRNTTGFLTSSNRADAENLASRFSPSSKLYEVKDSETEIDLLISTDVLSEGQNLQDAGVLINYDLHWNPVRMIQRNGRVNRLGSVFEEVDVYNMKPESELDSYLKLIQRLQAKIDIIRNTIGTDTPVLDEVENPIEYSDALSDIYSQDFQTRIKALDDAEKASDFLFSEDEFVMDLKRFKADSDFSSEYKSHIFGISPGKWGLMPAFELGKKNSFAFLGLSELSDEHGEVIGHQFVEIDRSISTVKSVSQLQALDALRASSKENNRRVDKSSFSKSSAKALIEYGSLTYSEAEEMGAPVGQEAELLRILHSNGYEENAINTVRNGFKTKDVFAKRDMDQLKRQAMKSHRKGHSIQSELKALIERAKDIERLRSSDFLARPVKSKMVLGYMEDSLNG